MPQPRTTQELEAIVIASLGPKREEVARTIVAGIEDLSQRSRINAVTGSPDIRALQKDVPEIMERVRRQKDGYEPIYIMMIDIDNFRNFNKKYGEYVGNEVLRAVNRIMGTTFRGDDALFALANQYREYHLHGEEMMAVYTCRSQEEALKVAERVRRGVEEKSVTETGYKVTISIGVTNLRADTEEFAAAQQRSDRYMQIAKKEGRNRVYCGETDPLFSFKEKFYTSGMVDTAMKLLVDAVTNAKGVIGRTATKLYQRAQMREP